MDRLLSMEVFVEVARRGSFVAAADRLNMSRPAVTRHVVDLEKWLGARLLQRTTRRVTLTEAGEQVLKRSVQMLELMSAVRDEVSPAESAVRGGLRVTSPVAFAHAQLAAAIGQFVKQHPLVRIDLRASDEPLDMVDQRIDLAIRITADPPPGLAARKLGSCHSVVVASPGYLSVRGTPRHPDDLASHEFLAYTNFERTAWTLTQEEKTCDVPVAARFTADETTVLLRAALSGAGVALVPSYLAQGYLVTGQLINLLPNWQPKQLMVYALYPSKRHLPGAVRALIDHLVEQFSTASW